MNTSAPSDAFTPKATLPERMNAALISELGQCHKLIHANLDNAPAKLGEESYRNLLRLWQLDVLIREVSHAIATITSNNHKLLRTLAVTRQKTLTDERRSLLDSSAKLDVFYRDMVDYVAYFTLLYDINSANIRYEFDKCGSEARDRTKRMKSRFTSKYDYGTQHNYWYTDRYNLTHLVMRDVITADGLMAIHHSLGNCDVSKKILKHNMEYLKSYRGRERCPAANRACEHLFTVRAKTRIN